MNKTSGQDNLFLFYGEECHLAEPRIRGLINSWLGPGGVDFGLTAFDADPSPAELESVVNSMPFFGDHIAVRIRDSRWFQAGRRRSADSGDEGDETADNAGEESEGIDPRLKKVFEQVPSSCLLVIQSRKADKRKKLFKLLAEHGQAVEYGMLRTGDELAVRTWVEDCLRPVGKTLARDALAHLTAVLWTMPHVSRGFIAKELEKASLYSGDDPVISRSALEAVMAAVPELNAFNMTEAIGGRQTAKALQTLHDLLAMREPELKIIGLLAYKVRQWWKVRQVIDRAGTDADIARALGAKGGGPTAARRMAVQSRSFSQEQLQNALLLLADANVAARSGGETRLLLERFIVELTGKAGK